MAESPSSHSRSSSRLSRSANACQRCRRRKQRCDLKFPKCSSCEAAQVACLTYHAGKQTEIPRNYVSSLESQVERLTKELDELRAQFPPTAAVDQPLQQQVAEDHVTMVTPGLSSTISDTEEGVSNQQELVKSMGLVVLDPSDHPRFLGTSSGVTLAKLVMASIDCDIPTSPVSAGHDISHASSHSSRQSSLPPRRAADHIIEAYFEYRSPRFPVLSRSQVAAAVDNAYLATDPSDALMARNAEKDTFITYMILALGLCDMVNSSRERPAESEGCFNSAIRHLESVLTYSKSDLYSLAIVLLVAQYVSLSPSKGSLWQLSGIALRIAIDLGLHWETDAILALDPTLLDQRRRLYWATYRFDRLLTVTLGRPFGIVDPSMSVGFPNPYDSSTLVESHSAAAAFEIASQRAANHLCSLARLESEIKHVLYHQLRENTVAYPRANYSLWIRSIQPRLQEWRASVPQPSMAHPKSIYACETWWDAIYNNALLFLHRPNPLIPHPAPESLRICFDASSGLIQSVKSLYREHKLDILWIWTHRLFVAGLTLMYSIWNSTEVRQAVPTEDIIATIQSAATTLAALSERFTGASGCRDAFETLASVTTKKLVSPQNAIRAEDEIHFLQQQFPSATWPQTLQPDNSMEDVFSLLSNETFSFSEVLGNTAQWPEALHELNLPQALEDFGW